MQDYVEHRDGGYYVVDTRVSLDSVVTRFRNGASPENIFRSFPMIGSLEKVYGALTFYLANQRLIEAYLVERERLGEQLPQMPFPQGLAHKLDQAKHEAHPR